MARGRRNLPAAPAPPAAHPGGVAVTPGALACPLTELGALADRFAADPQATLVVSDVHGDAERLRRLLASVGVVDSAGRRVPDRGRVIQIGDLVDGRRPGDLDALEFGERVLDQIVIGNHEAALLGGPRFEGLVMIRPEVSDRLWSLARRGQLVVAAHAGDVLITHAGVARNHGMPERPDEVVAALEDPFYEFCGRPSRQDPLLFAVDPRRAGAGAADGTPGGGVLWQDWASLLEAPAAGYRQLVGHSRLGGPEQDPAGRIVCLDPDGPSLGVALVGGDGQLMVATDA